MRLASLLLLLAACPALAAAQDAARGRELYQTYCGGCHYERVHDRLRSEVKDLSDLRDMVTRWAPQTKYRFSRRECAIVFVGFQAAGTLGRRIARVFTIGGLSAHPDRSSRLQRRTGR